MAALVLAGVILAVGFLALEFQSRMRTFRARRGEPGIWETIQIAGLSLAALTGVPQISEAVRGTQLMSDQPLSEVERWQLGLGGVVQLVVTLAGVRVVRSRIRARPAPRDPGAVPAPGVCVRAQGGSGGAAAHADDAAGAARGGEGVAGSPVPLGTSFGKYGTLVEDPGIPITQLNYHATRKHSVTREIVEAWQQLPKVVLAQNNGQRFLCITSKGAYVIDRAGRVITAYPRSEFSLKITEIAEALGIIR